MNEKTIERVNGRIFTKMEKLTNEQKSWMNYLQRSIKVPIAESLNCNFKWFPKWI